MKELTASPSAPAHENGIDVKRYRNLSGESGVVAYESHAHSIVVQFQDGTKYEYTERSAGAEAVELMKQLASLGQGLSTFISRHVRDNYERKFD
ncbi:hypothetical protein [Ideonella sp.]|uniref:hypothetical protein n=1 Tax=Ideonella sp. TaxID=1929293 RepID=UPI0039C86864